MNGIILHKNNKTLTFKITIIFFAAILFFTFFSKTIYYYLTPKVDISMVEGGSINNNSIFLNAEFYYDNIVAISIPYKIDYALNVDSIFVKKGDEVNIGDKLISFDASQYYRDIKNLETQIEDAKIQLSDFNKNYSDRIIDLNNQINDCDNKLKQFEKMDADKIDPSMKSNIENTKQKLQSDLDYIKTTGILNGRTQSQITNKLQSLNENLQKSQNVIDNFSTIYSDVNGKINKIAIFEKDNYMGKTSLIEIVPNNSSLKLRIKLKLNQEDTIALDTPCKIEYVLENKNSTASTINSGNRKELIGKISAFITEKNNINSTDEFSGNSLSSNSSDASKYAIVEFDKGNILPENASITKITTINESTYCDFLVPNGAFIDKDYLFVIKYRKGFFGEEMYIQKVNIEKGDGNEYITSVTRGLKKGDKIVINWDRELSDGQRVMLSLE